MSDNIRPIDIIFNRYTESRQHPINKLMHWICTPLIFFSLIGLAWSIPFPYLSFLGKYNGYLNWASFLIAFSIYYYYRLSPVISYVMLLIVFIFSALIVTLEKQHIQYGWPSLRQICLAIFILAWVGQSIGHKIEGKKPPSLEDIQFLLIGPIWLLHFLFEKFKIRY